MAARCSYGIYGGPLLAVDDRSGGPLLRRGGDTSVVTTTLGKSVVASGGIGQFGGLDLIDSPDSSVPFGLPLGAPNGSVAVVFAMTPAASDAIFAAVENQSAPVYELWLVRKDAGLLLRRAIPPRDDLRERMVQRITSIDADASGCTVYFTTGSHIGRFDVCSNRMLDDFTSERALSIRVLPDGGVLAASDTSVRRYNPDGSIRSTMWLPDVGSDASAVALDVDPHLAWVLVVDHDGCGEAKARLRHLDIDSGEWLDSRETDYRLVDRVSIAVVNGWYAAVQFPPDPPVPPRRRAVP